MAEGRRETAIQHDNLQLTITRLSSPLDEEGFFEDKFMKFASTYFQGDATHTFVRHPLKHSLLQLNSEGDELVNLNFNLEPR